MREPSDETRSVRASTALAMSTSRAASVPTPPAQQRAFALVVHGMVGTILWSPSAALWRGNQGSPRLVKLCSATHIEHVVRANEAAGGVDVFVHSWNPELASVLDRAYAPHLRASLHELPLYAEKTCSQALSIARAVRLLRRHERDAAFAYRLVFLMRHDLVVAAPILLDGFDPRRITFAEHCCTRDAVTPAEKAAVDTRCAAPGSDPTDPVKERYRKRLLGVCTPDLYSRGVQRAQRQPNNPYMVTDWWLAAAPEVLSKFRHISNNWAWYLRRAGELRLQVWSHHVWMILVHDVLNMTAHVAFAPGVRIGLARHVYPRLLRRQNCREGPGDGKCTLAWPLGNFYTDPTGECPVLRPSMYLKAQMVRLDPVQLRTQPIPTASNGLLFGYYEPRFASMAAQCSWARHHELITCCGRLPHVCGTQECPGADHTKTNWLAAKAAQV